MRKFIVAWIIVILLVATGFIALYISNEELLDEWSSSFDLVFSKETGFYDGEFDLSIRANRGATIYYTLDGSEPNPDNVGGNNEYYYVQKELHDDVEKKYYETFIYEEPLRIGRELLENNRLYEIQSGTSSHFIPDEMEKAAVIRAIAISEEGNKSDLITNTYFFERRSYENLPVISIVTDPAGLFDYYEGIYVPGETFDNLYDPEIAAWRQPSNSRLRGREHEIESYMKYFDKGGVNRFEQKIGIRIHGGATRSYQQKSLRLYARSDYGQNEIDYDLFYGSSTNHYGEPIIGRKRLILRNSGNDWRRTMLRDALMQHLVRDLNFDTQAHQPSIVYINGEYWGIHNIRERYDRFYIEKRYGIDSDDVAILSSRQTLEEGSDDDLDHYNDMVDFAINNDLSIEDNYEYIKTQMDVYNFIDYFISNIYFNNNDWPMGNIRYWRKSLESNDLDAELYGHDGRWRWLLFDTDFGFGLYSREIDQVYYNNLNRVLGYQDEVEWYSDLIHNLLENNEFKNNFIFKFTEYLNTIFEPNLVKSNIDFFSNKIGAEVPFHGARNNLTGWESNLNVMKDFAVKRPYYMRKHIQDRFDLGEIYNVKLNVTNSDSNFIINGISHNDQIKYPLNAKYYEGMEISLSMTDDYRKFSHFEDGKGNVLSRDREYSFVVNEDKEINAIYTPRNKAYLIIIALSLLLVITIVIFKIKSVFRKIDEETA